MTSHRVLLTEDHGRVADAASHDAGDVHGVDQGDETMSGQQTVSGLQGHNSTQCPRVTG